MDSVSNVWSQWKIVETIGSGSYGTVYKAVRQDRGNISYSAIKVIHIPQDNSTINDLQNAGMSEKSISNYLNDIVDNLLDEIKIMEQLETAENIVVIKDYQIVANDDGIGYNIFIRMELLEDLSTYLKTKELTQEEIVRLGMDICKALIVCNRVGIIHRDIKLGNIFVNKFGSFKLGDFGIARQLEGMTDTMSQKGTNMYMAPEVFHGKKYDSSIDLYSLGLVMYRLLNDGRMPFLPPKPIEFGLQEQSNAMLRRIAGEKISSPENADEELAEIILKACAYKVEDRYGSAQEMYDALESYYKSKNLKVNNRESVYDEPKTTVIGLQNVDNENDYENREKQGTNHKQKEKNLDEGMVKENVQNESEIKENKSDKLTTRLVAIIICAIIVVLVSGTIVMVKKQEISQEESNTTVVINDSKDNGLKICISGTTESRHYRSVQIARESEEFCYILENGKALEVSLDNSAPEIFDIIDRGNGRFKIKANSEGTGIVTLKVETDNNEILTRKLFISVYTKVKKYYGTTNQEANVYRGATDNGNVGNDEPKSGLYKDMKVEIIATCDKFYLIKLLDGTIFSDGRPTGYVLKENIDIDNN